MFLLFGVMGVMYICFLYYIVGPPRKRDLKGLILTNTFKFKPWLKISQENEVCFVL